MRSTVRIDDDVLEELKETARKERKSLTRALNETLRAGLRMRRAPRRSAGRFRQATHDLGEPRLDLDRALELAARLEDEATLHKLSLRK